jgi:hypothetical protein
MLAHCTRARGLALDARRRSSQPGPPRGGESGQASPFARSSVAVAVAGALRPTPARVCPEGAGPRASRCPQPKIQGSKNAPETKMPKCKSTQIEWLDCHTSQPANLCQHSAGLKMSVGTGNHLIFCWRRVRIRTSQLVTHLPPMAVPVRARIRSFV